MLIGSIKSFDSFPTNSTHFIDKYHAFMHRLHIWINFSAICPFSFVLRNVFFFCFVAMMEFPFIRSRIWALNASINVHKNEVHIILIDISPFMDYTAQTNLPLIRRSLEDNRLKKKKMFEKLKKNSFNFQVVERIEQEKIIYTTDCCILSLLLSLHVIFVFFLFPNLYFASLVGSSSTYRFVYVNNLIIVWPVRISLEQKG